MIKWFKNKFLKNKEDNLDLSPYTYDKESNVYYTMNADEVFHSFNGQPALVNIEESTKAWFINGKLHREDGPAIVNTADDFKAWFVNGIRHRVDGPAVIWQGKHKFFYKGFNAIDEEVYKSSIWRKEIDAKIAGVGGEGADKVEQL